MYSVSPNQKLEGLQNFVVSHPTSTISFVGGDPHMDVSENSGFSPQIIPFLIGFSIIINHPFWGTPIFGNTPIYYPYFPFKKNNHQM